MSRSKIIVELANGTVDTITALKRVKILLHFLNKEDPALKWIKNEIEGYAETDDLPNYRKQRGQLMGSYFVGTAGSHLKASNRSLPTINIPEDIRENMLKVSICDSVSIISERSVDPALVSNLPMEYNALISKYSGNPFMAVTSAYVTVDMSKYKAIPRIVENKLLDILLSLEEKFDELDSYDIGENIDDTDRKEMSIIINNIIFNNDESITIGDDNKINNSSFS